MCRVVTFLLACALFAGCATATGTRRSWNPLDWIYGRKAASAATSEAKATTAEAEMVQAAQVEVVKTGVALDAARREHPESRPVEVAQRTNANAAALLNQRQPLTVAETQDAKATADGLLSEEKGRRAQAEAAQEKAEGTARKLSEDLGELRARLEALKGEVANESANNLRLANELRAATLWKWVSTAGAAALGLLALAYRLNLGNLQTGVGEALGHFQKKYGTSDDDLKEMKASIDALVGKAQQTAISKGVASILAR